MDKLGNYTDKAVELFMSYAPRVVLALVTLIIGLWVIGAIVYTTMIWHTAENGIIFDPLVMLIPSTIMLGFAINVFEKKCPQCYQKFFGNLLRFLSSKSCRYCGYHGIS